MHILVFVFCSFGLVAAVSLQSVFLIPSFLASAFVGFVGSFLPKSKFYDSKKAVACVYTGSFAGMCSAEFLTSRFDIMVLCVFTGFSFSLVGSRFRGFGGKLGTIAFVSSLFFICTKAVV